jgi:hypothetical protein
MNTFPQPVVTSRQISKMAHVPHRIVIAEAAQALFDAGHNPNNFWHSHINKKGALKKELYLPRMECLIAIQGDFYSNNFRDVILDPFRIMDGEDYDIELPASIDGNYL